jgi:two-component system chemotaxis sensor kinase CheA
MKASKKDFIVEAEEIIENVNTALLELQNEFNPDTLNSVFRAIHTLKGLSGLFSIKAITDLSHILESLLDDLRLGRIEFSEDVVHFIFQNVDILKSLVSQVGEGKETEDVSEVIKAVESFRNSSSSREKETSLEDLGISPSILRVLSEYEEHRLQNNVKEGKGLYLVKTVLLLTDFAPQLETLSADLKKLGEVIATLPVSEDVPDGSIGFKLLFGSASTVDDIKSAAQTAEVEEAYQPKKTVAQSSSGPVSKIQDISLKSSTNTVRVDIEKLDRILDTISELVLAKGAVVRIGKELAETVGFISLTLDVYKISQTLERKLAELQDNLLELRMIPFAQIFARLAQIIRRYTREVGKDIEVELFGEDTKIDKQLAEEIIDPLIHIIRNAIDHGIESKDKRKAAGKGEKGTVTIKAFPEGNKVMVLIQDDGAGIQSDEVLRKAIERKLIPEDQEFKHNEQLNLIFLPGLSTKQQASEVSGRGVGMDIVKEKITSLGGFIEIESEKDKGTTFSLSLPITLAIIKALIVKVATEYFAIPLTSITETFFVNAEKIQTIENREVIEKRGEMFPLLRVADVLKLKQSNQEEYFAVVVGLGSRRLGLLVDNLLEQTEVVIRPLGEQLKDIKGLAGAAEIGRHEIVLVLDIEAMIEKAFRHKTSHAVLDTSGNV